MVNKIITSFDIWTTAQTIKSNGRSISVDNQKQQGIHKLRELILELAVRGKLVPQDPNDEPASELVKKIVKEKERLIKEGKIKKQKPLPKIGEKEKPYELPEGWNWARLGDLCTKLTDGSHNPPRDTGVGIPMLSSQNVNFGMIDFKNPSRFVSQEDFEKENQRTQVLPNDILLTIVASLGRSAVVPKDAPKFVLQRSVAVLQTNLNSDFLALQLVAPTCLHYYETYGKGTAQKGIYLGRLSLMEIALPPLAEQHRIVAKVDELMALCDQLEQQQTNSNAAHQTLVETLLGTLTNAASQDEFEAFWQRIANHFDTLFTTEFSIDQLKQTILQLAVMGKLVEQDPEDEPASELLKKIDSEKERLEKEGKIKLDEYKRSKEDNLFEIPEIWEWCKMQDLCYNISSGSTPPKNYFKEEGVPYIKVYNIKDQKIDFFYRSQYVDEEYHKTKLKRSIIEPGDVIMNIVGPPLGKIAIIPQDFKEWNCNQAIVFFKPIIKSLNHWIYLFLTAGLFLKNIELIGTAGQDNISVTKSKNILIPLPPLAEQERIVAKVDELFAICDALKERIKDAQHIQVQLAEAVVEGVMG
jgi:type I restriction enzyme S subunit